MEVIMDPIRDAQAAVAAFAAHVAPWCHAARFVVIDSDGKTIASLMIPYGQAAARSPAPQAAVPAAAGWDFSKGIPRFDGGQVPIGGRPGEVLKVLAEADGPVKLEVIRKTIWGDYPIGDGTVRFAIAELRRKLAEAFPTWEGDAVGTSTHGYTLLLR
jgi:hypothetical protein